MLSTLAERLRRGSLHLALVGLSAISFATTWSGMAAFVAGGGWLAWLIPAVFTAAVQAFLAWLAVRLFTVRGVRERLKLLGPLVLCWLVSVGFAYAFYWHAFRAADYAAERFSDDVHAILGPVRGFALRYGETAERLAAVRAYSEARAEAERAHGGTCGDGSRPGPGPRQALRLDDASRFGRYAAELEAQAGAFAAIVDSLGEAVERFDPDERRAAERAVEEARARAELMRDDPRLRELQAYLAERLRLGRDGFTAESGALIRCPDEELERLGRALAAALDGLPEVPPRRVDVFEPTPRATVLKVYADLARAAGSLLGAGEPAETGLKAEDAWPLMLAAMVDLFIVLIGWKIAQERPGRPQLAPLLSAARQPPVLDPGWLEAFEGLVGDEEVRIAGLLRQFELRGPRRSQLVVPIGSADERARQMERLATLLEALGAIRLVAACLPAGKLPPLARGLLGETLDGVGYVAIYRGWNGLRGALMLDLLADRTRRPPEAWAARRAALDAEPAPLDAAPLDAAFDEPGPPAWTARPAGLAAE